MANIEKYLCDFLNNSIGKSTWCESLFLCEAFVDELLTEGGLIYNILPTKVKNTITAAKSTLADYTQFKRQICDYGFTFTFGLSYVKAFLNYFYVYLKSAISICEKQVLKVDRCVSKIYAKIRELGLFTLLDRLSKFFNCVLNTDEECAQIATSKNYYENALSILRLTESNGTYTFDANWYQKLNGSCNSLIQNGRSY